MAHLPAWIFGASPSQNLPSPSLGAAQEGALETGQVDPERIGRAGIRRLEGKHLVLYTDLPPDPEVDCLPEVFDQAFEPFCAYFALDPEQNAGWKMTGRLMQDAERFRQAGLLPPNLPKFTNGFTKAYDFWIYEQPSAYYRRHLMLHEEVHGLMLTVLGSCGPTWYMEGIAELLATHRWEERRLVVKYLPGSAEEVPMWGRVKIVQQAVPRRGLLCLEEVIQLVPEIAGENELYGWCWALAAFLDTHPRYQSAFRQMVRWVRRRDFTERFFGLLGQARAFVDEEWKLFVDEICYGYDFARCAIQFRPSRPLPAEGGKVSVAVDRGWQSSGWQLEAGRTYRLIASGRYQLVQKPRIWWCEPGGVSIRYYRGRPLGMLLAAVWPEPPGRPPPGNPTSSGDRQEANLLLAMPQKSSFLGGREFFFLPKDRVEWLVWYAASGQEQRGWFSAGVQGLQAARKGQTDGTGPLDPPRLGLLAPIAVGLQTRLKPTLSGTLYFRINEPPNQLHDNAGKLLVRIIPER